MEWKDSMEAPEDIEELFLREQLQQKEMALEQEQLGKSQFIKRLTSDFEKPIEQLIQFSHMSLLRMKRKELTFAQNYVAEMKLISEELLLYLKDLREVAFLKTGESKFNLVEIDVKSFLKKLQKKFKPIAETAKVNLSFHMQPGGSYIIGDKHKLIKVTSILLANAIHRLGDQEGEQGLVKVTATHQKNYLYISIVDNGPKVEGKFLNHFHFDVNDSKEGFAIPGFSLSVCKEIMVGQKGDIQLISDKENKNHFILSLPLSNNF